jgi:hypothetical protein
VHNRFALILTDLLNRCHRLMYCHYPTFRHCRLNHQREIKKVVPLSHCRSTESRPITHDHLIHSQNAVFCHRPTFRHCRLNRPREINQGGFYPFIAVMQTIRLLVSIRYRLEVPQNMNWVSSPSFVKGNILLPERKV